MTELKVELVLRVSGDKMSECEDAVTQWASDRIKARIAADPRMAINAHRGKIPENLPPGLTVKGLENMIDESAKPTPITPLVKP